MSSTYIKGDLLTIKQSTKLYDVPKSDKKYNWSNMVPDHMYIASKPLTAVFMGYADNRDKLGFVAIDAAIFVVMLESCCFFKKNRRKDEKVNRSMCQ